MQAALLLDRGVVKVAGETARSFLNGLVTSDTSKVSPESARFAALLTPQGKILVDFIVSQARGEADTFYLDCPRALSGVLTRRLTIYRLRAKISIEDISEQTHVMAVWDGTPGAKILAKALAAYQDPRVQELGHRLLVPCHVAEQTSAELGAQSADASAYEQHRIALAVPRGGLDFTYGDAFPHETNMDQLAGVDFDKGCYVGQEVVSRMQHRGTARTRIVGVTYDTFAPETGLPVLAGERSIGTMGSGIEGRGLAMLRLDRVADALAQGTPMLAGGIALHPEKPSWARFELVPSPAQA